MTEREKKILYLAVVKNDEHNQKLFKEMKGHMTLDEQIACWFSYNEKKYREELSQW